MSLLQYINVIFLSVLYISNCAAYNSDTAQFIDTLNREADNQSLPYLCDDEPLKNLIHQVELLNVASENLRLKLDAYNIRLENELLRKNDVLLDNIKAILLEAQNSNYGSLINVRSDFTSVKPKMPTSCAEALEHDGKNGIYQLHLPKYGEKSFYVYCQRDPHNGPAWTVVQRRQDGSTDFFRNWQEYKLGFGNLHNEFFIGLDKLHAITDSQLHELWIQMEDFEGVKRYAKYDSFAIGDESFKYALNVLGPYSGDAGDSLKQHEGQKFTTKDADNDIWGENCATQFTGGWWYHKCHDSNLNGQYLKGEYPKDKFAKGIDWKSWHGHQYSLKYVHMAIRPKSIM